MILARRYGLGAARPALGRRCWRLFVVVVAIAAGVVMVPLALASELGDVVRTRHSAATEQEYRDLMTRTWEYYFSAPAPGPRPCTTVSEDGQPVSVVTNFHSTNSRCTVPANRPIYINEYTHQCSTIPGDHRGFGLAPVDIRNCTHTISRVLISVWLDGRNIGNIFGRRFWLGTLAFPVTLGRGRFEGVAERQVLAAAWGWSLLLRRLPRGTHTVKCRVLWGTGRDPRRLKTQSIVTLRVR